MKKFIFGLMAAGIFTSTSALANGSGYNGPDLNPVSIPVQLDRGISLQAIGNAITECLVSGNKSVGLKSTIQGLAQQMGARAELSYTNNIDYSPSGAVGVNQISSSWWFPSSTGEGSVFQSVRIAEGKATSNFKYFFGSGPFIGLSLSMPESVLFPYISYDKILNDGSYDEFGNLIPSSRIVSGLKIRFSVPREFSLAQIPLINNRTEQRTKFTINGEEYVQCLQSQLQLHSEK